MREMDCGDIRGDGGGGDPHGVGVPDAEGIESC